MISEFLQGIVYIKSTAWASITHSLLLPEFPSNDVQLNVPVLVEVFMYGERQ